MFAPYTPLDRCIGKEVTVRIGQENYTGMLSGIYTLHGIPMLVITPMSGGGVEQHIPLPNAMVMINPSI